MRQVDIKNFERYQITDDGRVWSKITNKWLIPKENEDGYYRVCLCHLDGHHRTVSVHRLVAEAYLEIPEELKQYIDTQNLQVNHKDEDKKNNRVENLEWCTSQYNNTYNNRHLKCAYKIKESNTIRSGKPIEQYTLDGELIAIYPSIWEASRQTGFTKQGIMIACHGGQMKKGKWVKTFQYKNFVWKYGGTV